MNNMLEFATMLKGMGYTLIPAQKEQVDILNKKYKLPCEYLDFLNSFGYASGSFLKYHDCFIKDLPDIQEDVKIITMNNGLTPLPKNAFVFWSYQGYEFAYFNLDEGDNPPVFYFAEGEEIDNYKVFGTIYDFFMYLFLTTNKNPM